MQDIPRIINMEETIDKTVGRRKPPRDPLALVDILQQTSDDLLKSCGHRIGRKGVFRFTSHEEADKWWTENTNLRK
jgi:hypothetical protein